MDIGQFDEALATFDADREFLLGSRTHVFPNLLRSFRLGEFTEGAALLENLPRDLSELDRQIVKDIVFESVQTFFPLLERTGWATDDFDAEWKSFYLSACCFVFPEPDDDEILESLGFIKTYPSGRLFFLRAGYCEIEKGKEVIARMLQGEKVGQAEFLLGLIALIAWAEESGNITHGFVYRCCRIAPQLACWLRVAELVASGGVTSYGDELFDLPICDIQQMYIDPNLAEFRQSRFATERARARIFGDFLPAYWANKKAMLRATAIAQGLCGDPGLPYY